MTFVNVLHLYFKSRSQMSQKWEKNNNNNNNQENKTYQSRPKYSFNHS